MRVISDIHGDISGYLNIIKDCDGPSVQLGDMGFNYDNITTTTSIDFSKHLWFGGNHDNYDVAPKCPSYLKNRFGILPNLKNSFYISGAKSIDYKWRLSHYVRTGEKIWWEEEEISTADFNKCLSLYKDFKPEIVFSHDCPFSLLDYIRPHYIFEATRTTLALNEMFLSFRPKIWFFGHHHVNFHKSLNGTDFICLRPNTFLDF